MTRVLVTGFEGFRSRGGAFVAYNPSAAVARAVGRRLGVAWAVLPVSFAETAPALLPRLADADVWVGVGLASARRRVEVESVALNVRHNAVPDNAGARFHDAPIAPGGPLALRPRWDVAGCVSALQAAGLPVAQSHHAGTFLCNEAFYVGLATLEGRAAFVHIPPSRVVPLRVATDVVAAVVSALQAHVAPGAPPPG